MILSPSSTKSPALIHLSSYSHVSTIFGQTSQVSGFISVDPSSAGFFLGIFIYLFSVSLIRVITLIGTSASTASSLEYPANLKITCLVLKLYCPSISLQYLTSE
nr:MAG TPA: hypothetical protein [Caudoviricetes sp.]